MKYSSDVRSSHASDSEKPYRKTFTWQNLNYVVPVPGGTRTLLHNVNGFVKPGTLTALMGASGAGMWPTQINIRFADTVD